MTPQEYLASGDTLVVVREETVVFHIAGRGIAPALSLFDEHPELRAGAEVYDTIVGKAAAAIYQQAGVRSVHAGTMSRAARELLAAHGIEASCEVCAEALINRAGTGLCPFEQAVLSVRKPADCLPAIRETMRLLRAAARPE